MRRLAMIPARMGSQRLARKNLACLAGQPLIVHAIRKCVGSGLFDEVWVNSEHPDFGPIAEAEGARFHQRPQALGDDQTTSEAFVAEFLEAHDCDWLFQIHSIAPLLSAADLERFVRTVSCAECDVGLSVVDETLECVFEGRPVNFRLDRKQNSQDLEPVRRIVWAVTAWRRGTYLEAARAGRCATYAGRHLHVPVDRIAGHVIKTQADLDMAEALWPVVMRAAGS